MTPEVCVWLGVFRPVWRPGVRRAGLDDSVTSHALRQPYVSLLIRHGEWVKTVQARLGHAAETLDTDDRTRAAVESALSICEERLRNAEASEPECPGQR